MVSPAYVSSVPSVSHTYHKFVSYHNNEHSDIFHVAFMLFSFYASGHGAREMGEGEGGGAWKSRKKREWKRRHEKKREEWGWRQNISLIIYDYGLTKHFSSYDYNFSFYLIIYKYNENSFQLLFCGIFVWIAEWPTSSAHVVSIAIEWRVGCNWCVHHKLSVPLPRNFRNGQSTTTEEPPVRTQNANENSIFFFFCSSAS